MLTDRWDVAHICFAVDDLEAAMERYTQAFGVEWGPILNFTADGIELSSGEVNHVESISPVYGPGSNFEGLREVNSVNGGTTGPEGMPVPALELAHARPFSPAQTIWGCRSGEEYMHHLAFWVDDTEAESKRLIDNGFSIELTLPPGDLVRHYGYLLSPGGVRIELQDANLKAGIAEFHASDGSSLTPS